MATSSELAACTSYPLNPDGFNAQAQLPYGLTAEAIRLAMSDFLEFITFINLQLHHKGIERLESMLMAANFSSIVGEFVKAAIPKYCSTLVRNRYHNGHPDLIPAGRFPDDSVQYAHEGVEVKGSRYSRGWQGHNPEDTWLMVVVFDSNGPSDVIKGIEPRPFRFVRVVGAQLTRNDWTFSGRSETSRRTITASVTRSGYNKMMANWIYRSSH
ncbi:MAG: hypothetical protein L0177_05765 [Chloroflexi bacterium]|nr:hypothetical protein [Chloroflexota bacterium]